MEQRLTRRGFAPAAVTAAVTGWSVASPASVTADEAQAPPPGPPADVPSEKLPPEDLLLAALVQLYPPEHLTPERMIGVRAGLQRNLQQRLVLRAVPLENSDAPAGLFAAGDGR